MTKLAVFCGSNSGRTQIYRDAAAALGVALADQGIRLVFGGTNKGLMKVLADAVLGAGGTAHGIIPRALVDKGQQYPGLMETEIVETRSLRKLRMAAIADGFVALPGGVGTIEELLEMWVDAQFDGHSKPIGLYNVAGFFDHLLRFIVGGVKAALPVASVVMTRKGSVSLPAPAEVLDQLTREADFVVSAMAD